VKTIFWNRFCGTINEIDSDTAKGYRTIPLSIVVSTFLCHWEKGFEDIP